jgi:predicted enzyme related to lactoylglutathione lyase
MFKVTKYPHGTFSWADCASTDAARSRQFYLGVMGWGYSDVPLGNGEVYTIFNQDGEAVAALSQMPAEMLAQGVPSFWNNYVTVDDVDALAGRVTALGGQVVAPPFDVFDQGRMMVVTDPTGAAISFWQARKHIGASLVNTVGAMCWNELHTRDVEAAKRFYGELLGWQFEKRQEYYVIQNNGRPNGGLMPIDPEQSAMPPAWLTYFNVADVEAAVGQVNALGGKTLAPVVDTPVGRIAMVAEPTGAVCAFIQAVEPQPWDVN